MGCGRIQIKDALPAFLRRSGLDWAAAREGGGCQGATYLWVSNKARITRGSDNQQEIVAVPDIAVSGFRIIVAAILLCGSTARVRIRSIRRSAKPPSIIAVATWRWRPRSSQAQPLTVPSDREGENRFFAIGLLNGRMVLVVWTPRDGGRQIISMMKAHESEEKLYGPRLGRPCRRPGSVDAGMGRQARDCARPSRSSAGGEAQSIDDNPPGRRYRRGVSRTGDGWQTRLNAALRDWLDHH